jgi:SPASM domain peptide maturase of grasp-with-spasm system
MNNDLFFKRYANCFLSKGVNEAIICDLQRVRVINIPNLLYDILMFNENNHINFGDLCTHYSQYREGLNKYAEFLIAEDLFFLTDDPKAFPDIDWSCEKPCQVSNAIINIREFDDNIYDRLLSELIDNGGCQALEVRLIGQVDIELITKVAAIIENSKLRVLNMAFDFTSNVDENDLLAVVKNCKPIGKVLVYNSPKEYIYNPENDRELENRIYFSSGSLNKNHIIEPKFNFIPVIDVYKESRGHNVGLNGKIFIDENFGIYNYPGHTKKVGTYSKENNITGLLESIHEKLLWNVTKDEIEICRDCKFKDICVDFDEILGDQFSGFKKSAPCNYSPYEDRWK